MLFSFTKRASCTNFLSLYSVCLSFSAANCVSRRIFGLWSIRIGVLIDHFHVPGLCERYYGIILSASRIVCMCYGGFVAGLDISRYVFIM